MLALETTATAVAGGTFVPETSLPIDREYRLAHCEGYRVESPGGRVGLVEEVRRIAGGRRAESLAVLA